VGHSSKKPDCRAENRTDGQPTQDPLSSSGSFNFAAENPFLGTLSSSLHKKLFILLENVDEIKPKKVITGILKSYPFLPE
jgi:hypothetical protein